MLYALLSSVLPVALLLHQPQSPPQLQARRDPMRLFRQTRHLGLSPSYLLQDLRSRPRLRLGRRHKLPLSFRTARTFRFSVSSSVKGFPKRSRNPPVLLTQTNPSTGDDPFQLVEDARSVHLSQCK